MTEKMPLESGREAPPNFVNIQEHFHFLRHTPCIGRTGLVIRNQDRSIDHYECTRCGNPEVIPEAMMPPE